VVGATYPRRRIRGRRTARHRPGSLDRHSAGNADIGTADSLRPHVLRDLRDGFSFVWRTPWLLWTLLFASMFVLVVLGPIEVLLPFIAQDRFADGARAYGFILAFFGVGSALGALTVSSRRLPRRYLTVMMVMWALAHCPGGRRHHVVVPRDGRSDVRRRRHRRRRDGDLGNAAAAAGPTAMLGRVSSLDFFVSLAFMPLSFAIVGPLSKVVSMQSIFLVAGILPVLLGAVAMAAAKMPRDEIANPLR